MTILITVRVLLIRHSEIYLLEDLTKNLNSFSDKKWLISFLNRIVNWFALNNFILVCNLFNWEIIIQLICFFMDLSTYQSNFPALLNLSFPLATRIKKSAHVCNIFDMLPLVVCTCKFLLWVFNCCRTPSHIQYI